MQKKAHSKEPFLVQMANQALPYPCLPKNPSLMIGYEDRIKPLLVRCGMTLPRSCFVEHSGTGCPMGCVRVCPRFRPCRSVCAFLHIDGLPMCLPFTVNPPIGGGCTSVNTICPSSHQSCVSVQRKLLSMRRPGY